MPDRRPHSPYRLHQRRGRGRRVAHAQFGGGHVGHEVFELVQFGQPFVGLIQVFHGGVNAGGEGFGVFGGDGVGANELDLLVKAFLLGDDQGEVFPGLLDALLALASPVGGSTIHSANQDSGNSHSGLPRGREGARRTVAGVPR